MRRNLIRTRIILIGTFTLITGTVWLGSELYFRFQEDTITPDYQTEIEPLNPRLQTQSLDQLSDKRSLKVNLSLPVAEQLDLLSAPIVSGPNVSENTPQFQPLDNLGTVDSDSLINPQDTTGSEDTTFGDGGG